MKTFIAALIIGILLMVQPAPAYFVAPYGVSTAEGDADSPKTLAWALSSAPSGSTVWLLPGTYKGPFRSDAAGVTFRGFTGARPILDGKLEIWGADTTWQGLELTYTGWTTRTSAYSGGNPADIPYTATLDIYGQRTRLLDSRIHDLAGVGLWKTAIDSEMRGNLVYNIGWKGTDRGHGPDVYSQNNPAGAKWIRQNVLLLSYSGTTCEIYGSATAPITNYWIEHNTITGRCLIGNSGGLPIQNIHFNHNRMWRASPQIGYTNPVQGDAEINDNYVAYSEIAPWHLTQLTAFRNTAINIGGLSAMTVLTPTTAYSYTIDYNTYYAGPGRIRPFNLNGVSLTLAEWQARGWDTHGSVCSCVPSAPAVFVESTGKHRGHVTVFDWGNTSTVSLDLSSLDLTPGAAYRMVNAQNPGESLTFVAGSPVSLPMTGWTVALPIGASAPLTTWDNRFAVFLVEPR